jgi:ParB/RepB/Spo0J family partition protein
MGGESREGEAPAEPSSSRYRRDLGEQRLDVEQVVAFRDQSRFDFDPAYIEQLAESITIHGQIQSVLVRRRPEGGYELIIGECRLRAIKHAGFTHINALLIDCDDDTALEICVEENLRRRDLNAIEEARAFRKIIERGCSQTSLAQRLNVSASHVSNRLRLLRLPDLWQKDIVSGAIPQTHARSLVTWADRPEVLADIEKQYKGKKIADFTVHGFEVSILGAVYAHTKPLTQDEPQPPQFEITDDVRGRLDVVEVPPIPGRAPKPRAFNINLWNMLQSAALEKAADESPSDDEDDPREGDAPAEPRIANTDEDEDADEDGSAGASPSQEVIATPEPEKPADVSHLNRAALKSHFHLFLARKVSDRLKPDATCLKLFVILLESPGFPANGFSASIAHGDDIKFDDPTSVQVFEGMLSLTKQNFVASTNEFVTHFLCESPEQCFDFELLVRVAHEVGYGGPFGDWVPDADLLDLCSIKQLRGFFEDKSLVEPLAEPTRVAKWERLRLTKELLARWPAGHIPKPLRIAELDELLD